MSPVRRNHFGTVCNMTGFGLHADFGQLLTYITLRVSVMMNHVGVSHTRDTGGVELAGSLNPLSRYEPLTGRRMVPLDLAVRWLTGPKTAVAASGVIHVNHHGLPRTHAHRPATTAAPHPPACGTPVRGV